MFISLSEAIQMVSESVEAVGKDFVYRPKNSDGACLYVHNIAPDDPDNPGRKELEPGCIVGDMIIRQHILTLDELYEIQETHPDGKSNVSGIFSAILEATGKHPTDRALNFLMEVQRRQDDREPWGVALGAARANSSLSAFDYNEDESYRTHRL